MKKFNLRKEASSKDFIISDKSLQKNREEMELSSDKQEVVNKNINSSLPIKNKDNTIPFEKQMEAARKDKKDVSIIEADMRDKEVSVGEKTEGVMPINLKTQEYVEKHTDEFKKAEEETKRDTAFWDKYVGMQLEGPGFPTKIDKNVPLSASQLENQSDRFKEDKTKQMIMASLKDADAMLFHIFATASKEQRNLNDKEKQQITDINAGKTRLLAKISQPLEKISKQDPIIKKEKAGAGDYEQDGTKIDEFKSCEEAKTNYPEGEVLNA